MSKFKVLIIGAGLGGLCLAQSLRRAQIDVEVFERDASPWDRPQGYRLHLDADGIGALFDVLPPRLQALFLATSMQPADSTTLVDTALKVLKRVPSNVHGGNQADPAGAAAGPHHVNVNRATLRQLVLTGLDDAVHYDARLARYESDASGVTAIFADGRQARGDVLIGADGLRSVVRQQRVPQARLMDSGIRALYARIPIETARAALPRQALEDVFTVANDSRKVFLGLGPVIFPVPPDRASDELAPEARLGAQADYVVSIIGGRREHFERDDLGLHQAGGAQLQALALRLLRDWPAQAAAIPALADPDSYFFVEMYSSIPCTWSGPVNVTLLGDAIHAMTPTLGRGANIAMRDAAMLGRGLIAVAQGREELAPALAAYEDEMSRYGFEVVRASARMGHRLIGQEPLPE